MTSRADQLHESAWHRLRQSSWGERLFADHGLRASAVAGVLVALCIALTVVSPLWLMLLAPLLLGVPHVAADLRFLILAPPRPLPRGLVPTLAALFATMTAVRVTTMAGGPAMPRVELAIGALTVAGAVAWGSSRTRWLLLIGVATLGAVALASPRQAALFIGHMHNLVAVGVWFAWTRSRHRWAVVGLLTVALGVIASGLLDDWWWQVARQDAAGLSLSGMVSALAPDLPGPWGLRAVIAFALLQAVHYAMWLGAIPSARTHAEPPPPSQTWQAWRLDLGAPLLWLTVLGTLVLVAWGLQNPVAARGGYLSLVLFHGWLELAVIGYLVASRD